MPSVAPIVINDGQATPVSHTFNPSGYNHQTGYRRFIDRSLGVSALNPEIHFGFFAAPATTSRVKGQSIDNLANKIVMKVMVPVPDVTAPASGSGIQPAPSKAYEELCTVTWTHPIRGGKATREDSFAYVKNLLALAAVKTVVVDQEDWYA